MQLLQNIFSSPIDLLKKVEADKITLQKCLVDFDEKAIRETLFNFVVGCYHLADWIKAFYPNLEFDVYNLLNQNKYLGACRDLCNASKHVKLDINKGAYTVYPPVLSDVAYSATGNVSSSGITEFKVKLQFDSGDRIRLEKFMAQVMSTWEKFFNDKDIK